MKINIITLGCSKNIVDSENLAGCLKDAGCSVFFDRDRTDCDVVVVNTCGFIGDAKEESVNTVLQQVAIKRRGRKHHLLVVVGCLVERYKDELRTELPEVDAWFGTHEWDEMLRYLLASRPVVRCAANGVPLSKQRILSTPRHYAYLKISEGCNRSCSYCAIPKIRGRHISRPIDDIVVEAKRLVACGVRELLVIAQDTTFYGLDLYGQRRLPSLLERLALESGADWIRLHYTYPSAFPMDLLDVMARHDNICKYIDIPLQHINTNILSSMQRNIDREGTLKLIATIRERIPDITLRTTLIVGYPGETEEVFQELKQFVAEVKFDRLGVFAYSQEENTPAEPLGDPVPDDEKFRRLSEIMTLQDSISFEKNQRLVGRTMKVLIDRREGDYFIGRSQSDSPEVDDEVLVTPSPDDAIKLGSFCNVCITQAFEHDLMAAVVI